MATSAKESQSGDWNDDCSSEALLYGRIAVDHGRRSRRLCSILSILLMLSLSFNLAIPLWLRQRHSPDFSGAIGSFTQLEQNKIIHYQAMTDFQGPNSTVADARWNSINIDPIVIAIPSQRVAQYRLPPSTLFPWDQDKSIYFIKGYHDLHCLKYIRTAVAAWERATNEPVNFGHMYHCLDGLRQTVLCSADDTPQAITISSTGHHMLGDQQQMACRDWDQMTAWAQQPEFEACYHEISDFVPTKHTLELYNFCPDDSPYRSIADSYFEIHGHKSLFNDG